MGGACVAGRGQDIAGPKDGGWGQGEVWPESWVGQGLDDEGRGS